MGFFLYSYVIYNFYQHLSRDLWHKRLGTLGIKI